ncbi:RNA polymerase sigma factor [Porticoccus sp. GXU_MW_L64]
MTNRQHEKGVPSPASNGTAGKTSVIDSFKRHEKSLRHYISGFFITPQDIEDITQETFLRTFKSDIKERVQKPKPFMFRVAKNLIMSEYRRSSYKLTDYIEDIGPDSEPLAIDDLENNREVQQKLGLFCEALAGLPEQCRRVVIMRKVYGFSIKEISKRLDMPTSTINWNIAKGMTACDNLIEQAENTTSEKQLSGNSKSSSWRIGK